MSSVPITARTIVGHGNLLTMKQIRAEKPSDVRQRPEAMSIREQHRGGRLPRFAGRFQRRPFHSPAGPIGAMIRGQSDSDSASGMPIVAGLEFRMPALPLSGQWAGGKADGRRQSI